MSKAIFRFLRGEINGYYLTNIHNALNKYTEEERDFLASFRKMQFNSAMPEDYVYGLGKFAGIYLPRLARAENVSSLKMSESTVVDGIQYSERNLFNTTNETFNAEHTSESETEDINTLATSTLRSSLVGDEEVKGYIYENTTDVLDDNGNVKEGKYETEVPLEGAYSNFYGNQFMFLSEADTSYSTLASKLYLELFKALQYIRHNGQNIESLCKIISIVCPNSLVTVDKVEVAKSNIHVLVYYTYNSDADVDLKQHRILLMQYIINMKFTQVELVETTGE